MASPVIPWLGGKRRLAKYILPKFRPHTCYVEPFCGAAALFFTKEPAKVEVINDINGDLVNLYRVIKHHPEEFARQFKWALSSRQIFKWMQITPEETLTDIQRAGRFYYQQKLCFGAKIESRTVGTAATAPPKLNLMRLEEDISAAHLRLSRACIEHLDWAEVIRKYDRPGTLFYCDPPYWGTEGYGEDFPMTEYHRLADLARGIQGQMIISVNDIPEMREAFAGLTIDSVDITYTVGSTRKKTGELVIVNR